MSDELFCGLTEKMVEQYNPAIAANEVIVHLRILVEITQGHGEGAFYKRFGNYFRENRLILSNSQAMKAQTPIYTDHSPEPWARERNSNYICFATAYAYEAIDEYFRGRLQHAWVLVTHAKTYLGAAGGSDCAVVMSRVLRSHQARENKEKSMEGKNKTRADVLKYYQDNINTFSGMSMEDAAEKIIEIKDENGNQKYDVAFSTLKNVWLRDFYKLNPSIPKPKKKNYK
jgi:hypothetical protein